MRAIPSVLVLSLIAASACGAEGQTADGGPLSPDAGTAAMIGATLPFATGEIITYEAPTTFDLAGGFCSCTGASAAGARVALAWEASRADTTGTFAIDGTFVLVATKLEPYAKYVAADGTVEITDLSPGTIRGTFSAARASLAGWQGTPPEPTEQLQEITTGTFECHGRTDGVYATCFQ